MSTPQCTTFNRCAAFAATLACSQSMLYREMVTASAASSILRTSNWRSMKMSWAWQVKPNGLSNRRPSAQATVEG